MDPNSRLIKYLWYSQNRNSLMKLFGVLKFYGVSTKAIYPTLLKSVKQNKTDFEIMHLLHQMVIKGLKGKSLADMQGPTGREYKRAQDILKLLSDSKQIPFVTTEESLYLDIGASDGLITKAIGVSLGLDASRIHAVDVKQWIGKDNKPSAGVENDLQFSFLNLEDKKIIPYSDDTFNLITLLQALHHFENLELMMAEVKRVCKPGGVIIIREHNADTTYVKALTDLEHLFYGILHDGLSIEKFATNYYGEYRSASEWDAMFFAHGFKCMCKMSKNNPTKYYYAVYVLEKSV